MRTFRVLVALVAIISTVSPMAVSAAGSTTLVISEMATGTSDNANKEFVELYNMTSMPVTLVGWSVEYKAATSQDTASSWTKRASLQGTISGHGYYLIAPAQYFPESNAEWSATLASGGGNIRVKNDKGLVIDQLAYGTGNAPENASAVAPGVGQSIERLPGRTDEQAGNSIDTDNNAADFLLRTATQPQSILSPLEPSITVSTPLPPVIEDETVPPVQSIFITELYINPIAPLTDAHDEYIELYNAADVSINLLGYQLQNGSIFQNKYVFPDTVFAPHTYKAFSITQTKLSLTNTAGTVRLVNNSGAMVDQTMAYSDAPDGQSWSLFDEGWKWTLQSTPDKQNIAVFPVTSLVSSAAVSQPPIAKTATVKKAKTTPKAVKKLAVKAPPKAKKIKLASVAKPKASFVTHATASQVKTASWLLISLIVLTIGYALYEFRHDVRNFYYLIRRNFRPRPETGIEPERRGDD